MSHPTASPPECVATTAHAMTARRCGHCKTSACVARMAAREIGWLRVGMPPRQLGNLAPSRAGATQYCTHAKRGVACIRGSAFELTVFKANSWSLTYVQLCIELLRVRPSGNYVPACSVPPADPARPPAAH
jgi:hypothetical protein